MKWKLGITIIVLIILGGWYLISFFSRTPTSFELAYALYTNSSTQKDALAIFTSLSDQGDIVSTAYIISNNMKNADTQTQQENQNLAKKIFLPLTKLACNVKIGVIRTANRNLSGHRIGTSPDSKTVDIRTLCADDRYVRRA